MLVLLAFARPAAAQTLHADDPGPMKAGVNRGAVDSFVGDQFWYFYAEPGHFQLVFSYGGTQEGFEVGGHAGAGAIFVPKVAGATITAKEYKGGVTWEGSTTQRARVEILVQPVKSVLVRQTSDYTLGATGNVSFGGGAGAAGAPGAAAAGGRDRIVGAYAVKLNDFGAAKFLPDGTIKCSNGASGTWVLFDADSAIYTVRLGGMPLTLTLQPGRGLIDTRTHNLVMELQR